MIASFRNYQSKMAAQNTRSALGFAVFTFLLVLIATFGVVYRYDLYPAYGTLIHIGLYHSPNISTNVKSESSKEITTAAAPVYVPTTTLHRAASSRENPYELDAEFFDKIIAVFASVKSHQNETVHATNEARETTEKPTVKRDHVKFPGDLEAKDDYNVKFSHSYPDEPKRANPEKLHDIQLNPFYGKSFYDRLVNMVSKDIAAGSIPVQSRNEEPQHNEILRPVSSRKNQGYPAWIEGILSNSPEKRSDGRTISTALSGLENFLEDLGQRLSSDELPESFELSSFPFVGLLDDVGTSLEVTEESGSDERDFFFGRNPKHFVRSEILPQFPHPVVDFPLNRNYLA